MTEVEKLENRIRNLSQEEFSKLREWFYQIENDLWDRQIGEDYKAGKFDQLITNAKKEFSEGRVREL